MPPSAPLPVLFATGATLFFVPAVFSLMDDIARFASRLGKRFASPEHEIEQSKAAPTYPAAD